MRLNRNLFFSQCNQARNVGDAIGPYLFKKITGEDSTFITPWSQHLGTGTVYLTCGSIIWPKAVKNNNTIIWGSGILNARSGVGIAPKRFCAEICAVRGKKTKQMLDKIGVKCPDVFGDPAMLVPNFYSPISDKAYDIGLVYHFKYRKLKLAEHLREKIKKKYKINLISVDLPLEDFCKEINKCDCILSSSLHGLILAHSYGVAAAPFHFKRGNHKVERNWNGLQGTFFKFDDYYSFYDEKHQIIYAEDLIDEVDLPKLIQNFFQPSFPINSEPLLKSCPFLR